MFVSLLHTEGHFHCIMCKDEKLSVYPIANHEASFVGEKRNVNSVFKKPFS